MPEFVSIISAGPHCSLQDGGRVGHQAFVCQKAVRWTEMR